MRLPVRKLSLGRFPTPIEELRRLSQDYGFRLLVKREDLADFIGSGNKVRKLEFLLADALEKGADTVITCGGLQSNHARATAYFARKLGLKPVLFLSNWGPRVVNGNLLLDLLLDAEVHIFPHAHYGRVLWIMHEYAEKLRREGRKPYVIPGGGTTPLGDLGYVLCVKEIAEQVGGSGKIDVIACAVGSGGTVAGLTLGALLFMPSVKVVGISVNMRDVPIIKEKVLNVALETANLIGEKVAPEDIEERLEIITDFVGYGYGIPSEGEIKVIKEAAAKEGLILDPVYTGKAFRGVLDTFRGSGKTVLFMHTGGTFEIFAVAEIFFGEGANAILKQKAGEDAISVLEVPGEGSVVDFSEATGWAS